VLVAGAFRVDTEGLIYYLIRMYCTEVERTIVFDTQAAVCVGTLTTTALSCMYSRITSNVHRFEPRVYDNSSISFDNTYVVQ